MTFLRLPCVTVLTQGVNPEKIAKHAVDPTFAMAKWKEKVGGGLSWGIPGELSLLGILNWDRGRVM